MSQDWLPDLGTLRCFAALAKRRSFRLAAKEVGLSAAAFSERIRRLEDELGAELFVRTTRKVEVTPAGLRLIARVEHLLSSAQELQRVALGEDHEAPYALTLGTRFELGMSWMVPAIASLHKSHPHRTIHLQFANGPELIQAVLARELDGFVASIRLTRAELAYALLHEELYVLVASPSLLKRYPLTCPRDALKHVLVDTGPALPLFQYFLDAAPSRQRWRFSAHEYMGTIAAVRYRVLRGAGVAVLPRYFVQADIERGTLATPLTEIELPTDWFRLVWRHDHPRGDQLHELALELREHPLR